ncbi:MAG TPA: ribulose-phosphate 3-epimerase [Candidatus Latescibacteria bacterium]|nr:ribulose-phosphate 3-epimerase [Candidatus Latescibacterota bacterium]
MPTVRVAPSLLAADFGCVQAEIERIEEAGADLLHLDIMDGHFVPNLSYGIPVVEAVSRCTDLLLDTHLMLSDPDPYLAPFAEAGAGSMTVHLEIAPDPERLLSEIGSLGCRRGLAVNPKTPVDGMLPWLEQLDLALVMSVEPGFGGQSFMPEVLEKVRVLRQAIDSRGLSVDIEIDGGVGPANAKECRTAGANWLVAGSAVFNAEDPARAIKLIRGD